MPKLSGFDPVPIRGPRALPFIGGQINALRVLADPIGRLSDLHARYGEIVCAADRNPALVCAFGPERNREVLHNNTVFDNNDDFFLEHPKGSALEVLSHALPFQTGETHKRHRRLILPAFTKAAIEGYAHDIVAVTNAVLDTWPVGQTADVQDLVRDLVRHVAIKCLFGLDFRFGDGGLNRSAEEVVALLTSPLTVAIPYEYPGSPFSRLLRKSEELVEHVRATLAEKRKSPALGRDMLSLLIRAHDEQGDALTDDELIGETNGLFFAGYDTQAKTLGWTLFLLAQKPAIANALLDEIEGVLRGGQPSVDTVPRMPYLDVVLKESMRLLPAVPMLFFRTCVTEAQLGPYTLPPRANVVLSTWVTHRDPSLYSEPTRFSPRRWEKLQRTAYEYMPFGAGPRMCIGAQFATLALRLMLPLIHQRFRFTMAHGARVSALVRGNILGSKYGLPMLIAPQDRRFTPRDNLQGDLLKLIDLSD